MSYKIFFKEEAQQDIIHASAWYEKQQAGLGENFLEAVLKETSTLQTHPRAYPQKYRGTREIVMKRFPFLIIYRVEELHIFVHSVYHTRQHPNKKMHRFR